MEALKGTLFFAIIIIDAIIEIQKQFPSSLIRSNHDDFIGVDDNNNLKIILLQYKKEIEKVGLELQEKKSEMMVKDKEDLIHKATGWMLRFAGDKEPKKLLQLLDRYAATMPRTMLRYSIEKLDRKKKDYYMAMKKKQGQP